MRRGGGKTRPIEDYLSNRVAISSDPLRKRLVKEGFKKFECEVCGLGEWMGEEIPLHLDHVNGNHNDNSLENLKILCPTCHAIKTRKDRAQNKKQRYQAKRESRSVFICLDCDKEVSQGALRCQQCSPRSRRKTPWPPTADLLDMLAHSNYTQVAKQLGVSDNAVRHHLNNNRD
jgi:Zn finger protein HypA/HybF involved in hydrogenase expression